MIRDGHLYEKRKGAGKVKKLQEASRRTDFVRKRCCRRLNGTEQADTALDMQGREKRGKATAAKEAPRDRPF